MAVHQIADVHEVALHRLALRIEHDWHGAAFQILIRTPGAHQVAPSRPPENIFAKGQRIFEVIFFHDPGRSQAAAGKAILDEILFEHHLFENFGKGIAAGISAVPLLLGNGQGMRVEKMSQGSIAADQDDLFESRAAAGLFQQPEQTLDRDIHHIVGSFLTGGAMQYVRNALDGCMHNGPIRDAALDNLQPGSGLQVPVVT